MPEDPAVSPEELLDRVTDRESFVAFVQALAAERAMAEAMEKAEPDRYCLGGALGWQNGDIASFLYAALAFFTPGPLQDHEVPLTPTWKTWAEFLWVGKIYE